MKNFKRPTILMILDGYGLNPNPEGNAIAAAKKPNLDRLFSEYPSTKLKACGLDVGLPEGQMGNSEVGHLNIGAGRIVYQDLTLITKSIEDGSFFENASLKKAMDHVKENDSVLHLLGLLSDGGVHSHINHLLALIDMAQKSGVKKVCIHCFLDGRDVPPRCASKYIEILSDHLEKTKIGVIGTVSGRYYAMDRDKRWDRVQKAYDAMTLGKGHHAENADSAVKQAYERDENDEFVIPTVTDDFIPVSDGDSMIMFNFRPDRAREITRTIVDPNFEGFERDFFNTYFVTMTQYDATMPNVKVAFKPESLSNTFGEYMSKLGKTQLRIAETEKYAHVTFFFNGGVEQPYEGEDRALINSPKVATYDMQPEMSAPEVTEEVVKRIKSGKYDAIILNFANCDMVGHTGVFEAAVKAVETVDNCVGQVVDALLEMGGEALITADHGNADQMVDYETGEPFTAHTTNVVPLILIGRKDAKLKEGRLADLAPTLLDMMGLEKPDEMTGESLLEK